MKHRLSPTNDESHANGDSMKPLPLLVQRLSRDAKMPTKGSVHSAGWDLYSSKEAVIPAGGKALVETSISIACPIGTYGRIAPRSGLASKNFIDVGAGVIDSDYRGEVKVLLFNFGKEEFRVNRHERIAQLILERIYVTEAMEVENLETTERGIGGFGSTGSK